MLSTCLMKIAHGVGARSPERLRSSAPTAKPRRRAVKGRLAVPDGCSCTRIRLSASGVLSDSSAVQHRARRSSRVGAASRGVGSHGSTVESRVAASRPRDGCRRAAAAPPKVVADRRPQPRRPRRQRSRRLEGPLRDRRDPPARPRAQEDVRLGHPQGAARPARRRPCRSRWCRPGSSTATTCSCS